MSDINSIIEPWEGHTGSEVEAFIKNEINKIAMSNNGKVGWIGYENSNLVMYDE